jgi:regulator of replication initiation timing
LETEVASLKQTIGELEKRLAESQAENATLQAGRQTDAEALSEAAENKTRLTGGFAEPPWSSELG